MAYGPDHTNVQIELGEFFPVVPAGMLAYEAAIAEVRGRIAAGEQIHRIEQDLDERECNGK